MHTILDVNVFDIYLMWVKRHIAVLGRYDWAVSMHTAVKCNSFVVDIYLLNWRLVFEVSVGTLLMLLRRNDKPF